MEPMGGYSGIECERWGFGTARYHRGRPGRIHMLNARIGTFRRECLDHVLIFGERHLRRILTLYSLYYNETRTHLGLEKDAPLRRATQRSGTIIATPILSGLHHRYARI